MTTLPTNSNLYLLLVHRIVLSQPIVTDTNTNAIGITNTIYTMSHNVVSTLTPLLLPHPYRPPWNALQPLPMNASSNASSLRHTLITSILNSSG
jgi:hypothetical protein